MTIPMRETRRQLSLFVPQGMASELEAARQVLDPMQARLIPAHVTLCREDELALLSEAELERRIATSQLKPITLHFGRPEIFFEHGILLNCIGGHEEFRTLREGVLGPAVLRLQQPHITLAHPRNPKAPGNTLSNATRLPEVISISFATISLIAQTGDEPWQVLQEFSLRS